ncbi:MAG: NAD(P)-binding domain-containing protein [Chloroflexota bacterium]
MPNNLKIGVVGTGVVGCGVLKAWVTRGYEVVGFDVNFQTIDRLRLEGYEVYHMQEFAKRCEADLLFVCISTPQSDDGSIYLDYLLSGIDILGPWIDQRVKLGQYPMIVMRSTMLPNLSKNKVIPALEETSGQVAGESFGYAHLPEILRETDALEDSLNIWQVVIGELDRYTGDTLEEMFTPILGSRKEKLLTRVPVSVAEASKIIMNTYNATIISYFNMMGELLTSLEIDAQMAIDLSIRMGEGSLNSWYGTLAGMPYGGKCLPKDVAALLAMARQVKEHGVDVPMFQLEATQKLNDHMLELSDSGHAPAPIKAGFRRLSAADMASRTVELYDAYHAIKTAKETAGNPNFGVSFTKKKVDWSIAAD